MPVEYSFASIRDRQGQAAGSVLVFRDVSAARSMALDLVHLAEHDVLTGLPNRLLLNERVKLALALAKRHERKLALLFLDLDGFKHINDSLGHAVGDLLLQSVAGRLVNCLRESDMVSRQGGDEFLVLLSELAHTEDAAIAASRILQAVGTVHVIGARALHVTTSIEEGLRRALELQEFSLHYQPKIDLKTGRITGAEALIRWVHPTRGMISPAQFIPVAEDTGLIVPIGNWVLREACRQARAWMDAGLSLPAIAVNVSAIELRSAAFLEGVFRILEETGLEPRALELELTESVLMTHAQSNESILKALRAKGIRLALDDFGTGYSSLSYLGRFAVDTLKIDQSFVRHVTTAPEQATLVAAVIDIGRHLKLRTVAEGVETAEELAFLQKHGCDEAQGDYFSRPVAPAVLAQLLEAGLPETAMHALQAAAPPNDNTVTR